MIRPSQVTLHSAMSFLNCLNQSDVWEVTSIYFTDTSKAQLVEAAKLEYVPPASRYDKTKFVPNIAIILF